MGLEYKETTNNSPGSNMINAIRIFTKTPTAIAAFFRARKGKNVIPPKKGLTFSENFFYMCFGKVPNKEIVKAFDVSLILYAEHEFNASTFAARVCAATLSDFYSCVTGAIGTLRGPLHGGANEKAMDLISQFENEEQAEKSIYKMLALSLIHI